MVFLQRLAGDLGLEDQEALSTIRDYDGAIEGLRVGNTHYPGAVFSPVLAFGA